MLKFTAGFCGAAVIVLIAAAAPVTPANAASTGCCMQRANTSAPWIQIGANFNQCKQRNRQLDGNDNILQPIGLIRWSVRCY